jgi:hypothetical protein
MIFFFFYLSGHPDIFILENNYFIKIKKCCRVMFSQPVGVHVLNSYRDIKTCCVIIYDFQLIFFKNEGMH